MAQKYKFGNGVWANKEGSTLAYNDENDNYKPLPFTFTRGSIATRVNKEGLIEVVGNDQPRIDYTDSADGVLLLEPSRTNAIPYSSDFSLWSNKINVTIDSNVGLAPDGTLSADRIVFNGTTNARVEVTAQGINATSYTNDRPISVWLKSESGTTTVQIGASSSYLLTVTATEEWQRFTYIGKQGYARIKSDNATSVLAWGYQFETNGDVSLTYPTSYIPTNGSTVTRATETCKDSGNSEVFNDSEGVLFADIAALVNDNNFKAISISDSTSSDRITLSLYQSYLYVFIADGGVSQFNVGQSVSSTSQYHKTAIKYKTNDCAFWIDGFEVATATSATMPTGLKELSLDRGDGLDDLYGKTKELGYYDTALTDAELEYMTSYRNWESMVNELNLNIIYNG